MLTLRTAAIFGYFAAVVGCSSNGETRVTRSVADGATVNMPERMQPSASPSAIGNPDFRSESVEPEWDQKYSSGGDEDTLADALGDVVVKAQIPSEPDSEGDVDGLAPAAPIVNPPPSVPTQPVLPPLVI